MARRRSAPAPRRSAPSRQPAPAPQNQMQPAASASQPMVVQQKQPGFIANVASTALGVGIGHTIAHGLTGALGGGGGSNEPQQTQQQQQPVTAHNQQQQYQQNPCELEMQNFFNCTQQQYDISMCQTLNDALRECKMRYSNPSSFN